MKRYTKEDNSKDKNRFKLLMEYDFYIGEDEVEDEENIESDEAELEADTEMGEAPEGEEAFPEELEATDGEEFPEEPEIAEPEPMEDEVELDVTELVQGTEAAKASADDANNKIEMLLAKFDTLSKSLDNMSAINNKIENLENEIEKRNPTPEEKLEMRSLDSYPYSMKLTDFWSEKEGRYDAMKDSEKEDEEYVLTQDDVDSDFNAQEIKDSFRDSENYKLNKSF
jgi:hypothetical protein